MTSAEAQPARGLPDTESSLDSDGGVPAQSPVVVRAYGARQRLGQDHRRLAVAPFCDSCCGPQAVTQVRPRQGWGGQRLWTDTLPVRALPSSLSGRSLAELTVDDLLKKRRPWCVLCGCNTCGCLTRDSRLTRVPCYGRREFAGGNRPLKSFSVPSSIEEASFKLTENVFEFIGNYLILGLVCVCCVLCVHAAGSLADLLSGQPLTHTAHFFAAGTNAPWLF